MLPEMMMTPHPRIAILGAGPVGLNLASILHANGIAASIFERESSATARAQGGTLDIHADSGQLAIKAAGLLAKFQEKASFEREATRLVKKDGTVLRDENENLDDDETKKPLDKPTMAHAHGQSVNTGADARNDDGPAEKEQGGEGGPRGRPEIDRKDLKDLFINSLPEGTITWNKGVASISPATGTIHGMTGAKNGNSNQWHLTFTDGTTSDTPYDLVVGADGAWSRAVRPHLTETKPFYSGVTGLDLQIRDVEKTAPHVARLVGAGSCMIFADDRALLFQHNGDGSARCYACVRTATITRAQAKGLEPVDFEPPTEHALLGLLPPEQDEDDDDDASKGIDWNDEATRTRFLERNFADFFPESRRAALDLSGEATWRPFYMLPVGLRWPSRPGLTLVGDAAHLQTPFAGVGVNTGLMDSLELATEIVAHVRRRETDDGKSGGGGRDGGLAGALQRYEVTMFERSARDTALTACMMELEFSADGPDRLAVMFGGGGGFPDVSEYLATP